MRTAQIISTAYKAAEMLGKTDGLTLSCSDGLVQVEKADTHWDAYSSDWAIYVATWRKVQRAYLYIPRTGEERAISATEAEALIMGVCDEDEIMGNFRRNREAAS